MGVVVKMVGTNFVPEEFEVQRLPSGQGETVNHPTRAIWRTVLTCNEESPWRVDRFCRMTYEIAEQPCCTCHNRGLPALP